MADPGRADGGGATAETPSGETPSGETPSGERAAEERACLDGAWARLGGAGDPIAAFERLSGGVSSDVWRCHLASGRRIVAKRPLARLRVAMEWRADPRRGAMEARWLDCMADHRPGFAPRVVGYVEAFHMLFMEWLDEGRLANWREVLLAGRCDVDAGRRLGAGLAAAHGLFAADDRLRAPFQARDILMGTRIDPYFDAVAAAHPAVADRIRRLAEELLRADTVVIHGDVSPKNVLVGPGGPVLLDAECACLGEPAFDPAFFLAQLCLKSLVRPDRARGYRDLGVAFVTAYLSGATFTDRDELDRRVVRYLALFMLGRIDGKVPVPYLRAEPHKALGRRFALSLFDDPPAATAEVIERWCTHVLSSPAA
ncbi:phosphotransferase family protein [Azospirillum sp. ST 5-10]|uniref:phosphotransferase family protein n=1 Tax=unclassified Azospirillum TaxID=2630922 RepID=UPI003F49B65F